MYFEYHKYVINGVIWEITQASPQSNFAVKRDGNKVASVPFFHMALVEILKPFYIAP